MAKQKRLMQGNEACAEGALYAGCTFFAGYPITPSTEVAEVLAARLPKVGGKFIQMEDEIAAISAIIGASLAGRKSITATSGPGLSLKQEGIGFACMTEVPCVIVDVMRAGPSTGFPTGPSQSDIMQARWGTHGDHPVIALTPAYVQELVSETVRAFNLAERFRTPVFILYDEIIGHMREPVEIPEPGEIEVIDRVKPTCPPEEYKPYDDKYEVAPLAAYGDGYRFHVTGLNHAPDGFPTANSKWIQREGERLMTKISNHVDEIVSNDEFHLDDAEIAIFAYGTSARSARFAVKKAREKGIKAGLLRPLTIWPFPEKAVEEMANNVKVIIVPEMNLGQASLEIEKIVKGRCEVRGINSIDCDPIHPEHILDVLESYS